MPHRARYAIDDLVLSRLDRHVAWRGVRLLLDPPDLIDRVRGGVR